MGRLMVIGAAALLALAGWLAVAKVHEGGFDCGGPFGNALASDLAVTQTQGATLRDATACDSARSSRKTLTIGLGLVALVAGAGGVVVSRREAESAQPETSKR